MGSNAQYDSYKNCADDEHEQETDRDMAVFFLESTGAWTR